MEFSKAHPALAPMLSGPTQDPDVERLLEGTAFLTGMLRQKLEDEFPEVIHGLMSLIFPHYLHPIPSSTIVAFTPKPTLQEPLTIPAGTSLASVPVDGTKCLFSTCYDVQVLPMAVTGAGFEKRAEHPPAIRLDLQLSGMSLSTWRAETLRLHVSGVYNQAADIYRLIMHRTRRIKVVPAGDGSPITLPPNSLKAVGLADNESLLPYPSNSFPGYRVLQEYFVLPGKFLFLDLTGLERWRDRGTGTGFQIIFELADAPPNPPSIRSENFTLFATPVVNIFDHDADPISLDHRQPEYKISPSGGEPDHYQVYSVESVTGFLPGSVDRRDFVAFEFFAPMVEDTPVYYINRKPSPLGPGIDLFMSVAYPPDAREPSPETVSIKLRCTNGRLAEKLQTGDISQQTSSSPELCEFRNLVQPTSMVLPPIGQDQLWRFLSHLSLNLMQLGNTKNLQALLRLYIFPDSREQSAVLANQKRIEGIRELGIQTAGRLVSGLHMRGHSIELVLNSENFAGAGDMYLFGTIMDFFLGTYASINCFTQVRVRDSVKGDTYVWPARTGDRPLL